MKQLECALEMQLNLKDNFPCKFVYLSSYHIVGFIHFKKPLILLESTSPVWTDFQKSSK